MASSKDFESVGTQPDTGYKRISPVNDPSDDLMDRYYDSHEYHYSNGPSNDRRVSLLSSNSRERHPKAPISSGIANPGVNLDSRTSYPAEEKVDAFSHTRAINTRRQRLLSLFTKWWMWEILAGILSLLCLVAIVIVLAMYDDHPQPSLRWGITINAVIALLATVMKASLTVPLAQCISQLKWISFAGVIPHPITDFDLYDNASRGGWGNVRLLWRLRRSFWKKVITLAAVFYIISIGIDVFAQQLIQTTMKPVNSTLSTISIAHSERYDPVLAEGELEGGYVPGPLMLDLDMIASIYLGAFGTSTTDSGLFVCPSGNCTYPVTPSLGVCSHCNDVENLTTYIGAPEANNSYWRLGIGTNIWNTLTYGVAMNSTWKADSFGTLTFKDKFTLLASVAVLRVPDWVDIQSLPDATVQPEAWECGIYICVEARQASVVNGILNETVVASWSEFEFSVIPDYSPDIDMQILTDDSIPGPSKHSTFNISKEALADLSYNIPLYFSSPDPCIQVAAPAAENRPRGPFTACNGESDLIRRLSTVPDIPGWIARIAAFMSGSIRRNPAQYADYTKTEKYTAPAYPGTTHTLTAFIHITWLWIALPAAVVLFVNLFLVYVILKTSRVQRTRGIGIWKSRQLPMFYHGLRHEDLMGDAETTGPINSVGEMDERAEHTRVRLVQGPEGLRLHAD